MSARFRRIRTSSAVLLASAGLAGAAGAQQLASSGAAEFSGNRRGTQLLGWSASSGLPGLSPVLSVTGIRFTFAQIVTPTPGAEVKKTADAFALAPTVGLRYQTETRSTGLHVGYAFIDDDGEIAPITSSPIGSSDGVVASFQYDYWGRAERIAQLIANYNFGGEYLWTRAKGSVRFPSTTSPLFLGAELIFQGGGGKTTAGIDNAWAIQGGPVLMLQLTPNFRIDLSGGARMPIDDPADESTSGYGRIEFVGLLAQLFR